MYESVEVHRLRRDVLKSVKEIADFLIDTMEQYNQELALNLMRILENEPLKNFVNFYEAYIIVHSLGNADVAEKCRSIAELERSLVKGIKTEHLYFAISMTGIEVHKEYLHNGEDTPDTKDKYLYVLEFENNTVKIGITNEPQRRMKAISSASGMNITRHYFTKKIKNVIRLETELHKHFKKNRLNGEFFSISYEEAVAEVIKRTDHRD